MRYCGIDVSARPAQQQLCTLHPRRAADGSTELVATFYEPGDVAAVVRTVLGFGREAVVAVDAPSGRRLDLLAPGSGLRDALGLPEGRYQRSRGSDPRGCATARAPAGACRSTPCRRPARRWRRGRGGWRSASSSSTPWSASV